VSAENGQSASQLAQAYSDYSEGGVTPTGAMQAFTSSKAIQDSLNLSMLIQAFQDSGHKVANLDPLGLDQRPTPRSLEPATYGFTEADLDKEFFVGAWNATGFLQKAEGMVSLRDILDKLRTTYCGSIGYEYNHIADKDKVNWIRERIEKQQAAPMSKDTKLNTLDRLIWSYYFEEFLATKYTAAKRFGLEGGETLIPGMKAAIDRASELGVESVVVGMPHRGRLNVLGNVFRKPLRQIFSEFAVGIRPNEDDSYSGSGDVKYHLGTSRDRPTLAGKNIHLSLMANPSHLEAVTPVVIGKVRAKQHYTGDTARKTIMPIVLHGDGSHAGQGVVYESYDMSALPEYTVGGTMHIIVNNQVAFTTDPRFSRSSDYCTDVAKGVDAPIFHVNGDDVEAVCEAMKLAVEYRQAWKSDCVVDIVCYRKFGHNEIDEPMFTQPLMYQVIKKHPNVLDLYTKKLKSEGTVSDAEIDAVKESCKAILNEEFEAGKTYEPAPRDWLASHWEGFKGAEQESRIRNTGIPEDELKALGKAMTTIPEGFTPHKQVKKLYANRAKAIASGEGIDWGTGEALAYASLLNEGVHVRLSGQDVERGTFTHRHAVLHDQKTGERWCSLDHLHEDQPQSLFKVSNSALSEYGVLGFELGYSMENPNSLVLWEAQFGDFANGAQIIFDQFLSSGEAKWLRQSGLVVLLPHGYDGQGPEHSSARLERFLQMCDDDPFTLPDGALNPNEVEFFNGKHLGSQVQQQNWQVANVTTPANYFHLLRRQVHRQFRKPLLVMTPKNLLRLPECKSPLSAFDDDVQATDRQGVRFKRLIMDDGVDSIAPFPPEKPKTKRLVLCSGKIYYEIAAERAKKGLQDEVAICRVEQLSPFPFDLVLRELRRYPNAEVVWCQEEPKNMGAYTYVMPRIECCLRNMDRVVDGPLPYAGRPAAAATATGFSAQHNKEQAQLVEDAVHLE